MSPELLAMLEAIIPRAAPNLYLNKPYGVADLTTELANSEPMQHIRNRYGKYWERQWLPYRLRMCCIGSLLANSVVKSATP
jgi:hypothetical protein